MQSATGDQVMSRGAGEDPVVPGDSKSRTLSSVRAGVLEALRREDIDGVQRELPHYEQLLGQALDQPAMSAEQVMRFEADHQRFYEQVRASLLTMRIGLRLELERVRAAKSYQSSEARSAAVDMQA